MATEVAFKNCVPSTKCIIKIDVTTIDDAENLDLVMPMYNLIEYSLNYCDTTGSLCFFFLEIKQIILMLILQTIMIL